jgi:hypothetical protein
MISSAIRVRLLREHIVNARTFKAGMVVNLPAPSAQFVVNLGVGVLADPLPSVAAPEPATEPSEPESTP